MKHRLFNLLAVLSLLLCVAIAVLWVRSWCVSDYVVRSSADGVRYVVISSEGHLRCWSQGIYPQREATLKWELVSNSAMLRGPSTVDREEFDLRYWQAFLWTTILPVWVFLLKRSRLVREKRFESHRPVFMVGTWLIVGPIALLSIIMSLLVLFFGNDVLGGLMWVFAFGCCAALAFISCRMLDRTTRGFLDMRHMRTAGLCRVCGFDLRATPSRCPECGTIPETAQTPRPNSLNSSKPPIFK